MGRQNEVRTHPHQVRSDEEAFAIVCRHYWDCVKRGDIRPSNKWIGVRRIGRTVFRLSDKTIARIRNRTRRICRKVVIETPEYLKCLKSA